MTDRESNLHAARVCIAQARAFFARQHKSRNFGFVLLDWAGNARRRAMHVPAEVNEQISLF